jgi:prevent-host-death family protein
MTMKRIAAGAFKAQCLKLMEEVRSRRTEIVITKRGKPVAKLSPVDAPASDVLGCMVGTAEIRGDVTSPLLPASAWTVGE